MDAALTTQIETRAAEKGISQAMAWHEVMAETQSGQLIVLAFDPSQPRDEQGQWSTTGGAKVSMETRPGAGHKIAKIETDEWRWTPGFSPQDDGRYVHTPTRKDVVNVYGDVHYMDPESGRGAGKVEPDTEGSYRKFREEVSMARARVTADESAQRAAQIEATRIPRAYPRDEAKAREYDRIHNEGGEGYNPYR